MRKTDAGLHADRRARILAAAEQVFAAQGFHKASMQDIAAAAGMSPGNLYRYFPSKNAIIQAFAEAEREESAASFADAAAADTMVEGLLAAARGFLVEQTRGSIAVGLEVVAEATRNPAISAIVEAAESAVHEDFRRVLAGAQQLGRVRQDLDPDAAATLLLAVFDGLLARRLLRPSMDLASVIGELRELLGRYLERPPR
jgi:AcrR family transcriptional regulator